MPAIGYVTQNKDGSFTGHLRTLTIRAGIEIAANDNKTADAQPDFRVTSDGVEVGAGWKRHSESSGRDYIALTFAAPEFGPRRLYANLGRAAGDAEDRFVILWNPAD